MSLPRLDSRLRAWLVSAVALLAFAATQAFGQAGGAGLERQVKAAFLYRFIEYVRWPESAAPKPEAPIVIGVLADPAMVAEVQAVVAGRTSRGHPVVVRQMKESELAQAPAIHVLFIGEQANNRLQRIIRSVEGPVLIVTEAEDGLAHGAVINFVIAERRVRFEVSLMPAAARSLAIGSGLLSVAINVRKDSRAPGAPEGLLSRIGFPRLPRGSS